MLAWFHPFIATEAKKAKPNQRRMLQLNRLEDRLNPSSLFTRALDMAGVATVSADTNGVHGNALTIIHNTLNGGLGNFPTGRNDDFLLLSTGDATKAFAPRSNYPAEGLDWGIRGSSDDQQYLKLTIPVESYQRHLRFDLDFMTDEVPGPTNDYNDQFFILATPVGAGFSQAIAQMSVNDDLFLSTPPVNAIYARHTGCYTVDYEIPLGATAIVLDIVLDDRPFSFNTSDRDGQYDSALALDNFRFGYQNTVWLNFDGGVFNDYPVKGGTTTIPAFQPADIRSAADRTALINSIFNDVAAKFAAYDIDLRLTQPSGPALYSTLMIGGTRATPIVLGSTSDPRLLEQFGTNTTIQAVKGNIFGHAEMDYRNTHADSKGFVLSGAFGLSPLYAGDDVTTLQKRLVVTTAHEIAHTLGAPHVADGFDNNIMASKPPRSPNAVFEDMRRPLTSKLSDGRTELNIHGYLASVLGLAAGTGFVNGPALGANGRFFKLNFGVNLFDVRVGVSSGAPDAESGVDEGVEWFSYNALPDGTNEIELPDVTPESQIIFYGSTTAGGPPDFFSGTPTAGMMSFSAGLVPLFDSNGDLKPTLAAATGELGQMVPLLGGVGLGVSPYNSAGLQPLPKTGLTVTDDDGDTVTVKLSSKLGSALVQIVDPEGDGRGHLGKIELKGTLATDKLTISVKKSKTLGGDGFTSVGGISGAPLGTISASRVHLDGEGVSIPSLVRSITFRDIRNGADITTGGNFNTTTTLRVHDVGDNTTVNVDGRLRLYAARVGAGDIRAAMLTTLSVRGDTAQSIRGDFKSDVTIDPGKILTPAEAKLNLLGTTTILGHVDGSTFTIPGNVGTFRVGTFEHSSLLVGFTATNAANAFAGGTWNGEFKIGSFSAIGFNGYTGTTFDDSQVVTARIGNVSIANLDTVNPTRPIGFMVKGGLLKNRGTITLKNPAMKILATQPLPLQITDFIVQEL